MTLNEFAANQKREIFQDLEAGREPNVGKFDAAHLADCRSKGEPQVGKTRLEPHLITHEYLFPDPVGGAAMIFTVEVEPPERIVFLPVPEWVVETIWQGEIAGTHHFESEANRLVEAFRAQLAPEANKELFGPQPPKRRE